MNMFLNEKNERLLQLVLKILYILLLILIDLETIAEKIIDCDRVII